MKHGSYQLYRLYGKCGGDSGGRTGNWYVFLRCKFEGKTKWRRASSVVVGVGRDCRFVDGSKKGFCGFEASERARRLVPPVPEALVQRMRSDGIEKMRWRGMGGDVVDIYASLSRQCWVSGFREE